MKTKKYKISILLFLVIAKVSFAEPPVPPAGKVWVLNQVMSDEFDANSPDIEKWKVFDKGDSWDRTAAFDKRVHEAVKDPESDNYFLTMNPMWYYEDERFTSSGGRTYKFAGGGMDTRNLQTYGYFEVRIKPSDFPMGSGVFMNSRGTSSDICNEKYATELDIIENMGFTGPDAGNWNNYQHVNSHAKPYSDANGSCERLPYESENSGVIGKPLAAPLGFNTVGMWWKDENTAEFYNNDNYFGTITPRRKFNLPMPIIIVMETYSWGDDENNATNPKPVEWMFEDDFRSKEQKAVMFDWVRVWELVDIDNATFNSNTNSVKGLHDNLVEFPTNNLSTTLIYSSSDEHTIVATLYDPSGVKLADSNFDVTKGVRSIVAEFDVESKLPIADGYSIVYDIKDGNTNLKSATTLLNIIEKPLEKKLWRDGIPTSLLPGKTTYNIDVQYEADTSCVVVMEIRKPDGSWFGGGSTNVSAGNGIATVNVVTSSITTIGANYFYKVYMHRQGYDWRDPENTSISPSIYFNVEEPLIPSIQITSAPAEIQDIDTQLNVEFHYETFENGLLDIELVNGDDLVVARESRNERIGSRTLTRVIELDSVLTASSDYKIAIGFSPENNSFNVLRDTVYNIIVNATETISPILNSEKDNNVISIYPNPLNGNVLNVACGSEELNAEVSIIDTVGRLIHGFHILAGQKIQLSAEIFETRGIYFIQFKYDTGQIETRKVMIQ
ncbi:MAG: T9SS type A sorting domain-containing protein [Reichenbachiella sp.]